MAIDELPTTAEAADVPLAYYHSQEESWLPIIRLFALAAIAYGMNMLAWGIIDCLYYYESIFPGPVGDHSTLAISTRIACLGGVVSGTTLLSAGVLIMRRRRLGRKMLMWGIGMHAIVTLSSSVADAFESVRLTMTNLSRLDRFLLPVEWLNGLLGQLIWIALLWFFFHRREVSDALA